MERCQLATAPDKSGQLQRQHRPLGRSVGSDHCVRKLPPRRGSGNRQLIGSAARLAAPIAAGRRERHRIYQRRARAHARWLAATTVMYNARCMSQSDGSHGEVLKASGPGQGEIEVGMEVVGFDGQNVGQVKEVRGEDFLLNRPMARDLYVPYKAVLAVQQRGEKPQKATAVVLEVTTAHLDSQGWKHP
jgi:hypothetical protein